MTQPNQSELDVDSFEDRHDEGYQEGYDKALENAINAVEGGYNEEQSGKTNQAQGRF